MKNRILSLVLATLMVVSMTALFAVSSTAEDAYVTVVVGTAYGVPGETAMVDVYIQAEDLPAGYDNLRNWQFVFEGATGTGERACYVSKGDAYGFFNEGENKYGVTSDAGFNCGKAEWFLARGGFKIASLGFTVPADAVVGDEIEVTVSDVEVLTFETEGDTTPLSAVGEVVAGKIVVVDSVDNTVAAYAGDGEIYTIPSVDENGKVYNKLAKGGKLTGEFETLIVPATITSVAAAAIKDATIENIVLKGLNYDKATVGTFVEKAESTLYYLKAANGTDTTKANIDDYIENDSENEPDVVNLLQTYVGAVVDGQNVSVVAGLAVADFEFEDLTIVVDFGEKVKEATVKGVYKTILNVASTDADAAAGQSLVHVDGMAYIAGLTVKGVPAGSYDLTITLYGTTTDANGNTVVVVSDPAACSITVD